ncbi:MAG: hypothetical protein ABI867_44355, partial [Kofleriaceae bacterium]
GRHIVREGAPPFVRLLLVLVLVGCKEAPPEPVTSPPQPVVAPVADSFAVEAVEDPWLVAAFAGHFPRLPAISGDGASIAMFQSTAAGPGYPSPLDFVVVPLRAGTSERLSVIEQALLSAPPPADQATVVHKRAASVLAKLRAGHYVSLEPMSDAGLAATIDATTKQLTVTQHAGTTQKVAAYKHGAVPELACTYEPELGAAYRVKQTVYSEVLFRRNTDCEPPDPRFLVWQLPDELATLVDAQFDATRAPDPAKTFVDDAPVFVPGATGTIESLPVRLAEASEVYTGTESHHLTVTRSRDRKTAWASVLADISILPQNQPGRDDPWRASDVLVKTAAGWRIAAMAWSRPVANAVANRDAKAGTLRAHTVEGDAGDAELRAAFAKLATSGVDADAATRTDLVAIGSGPGERTIGGAIFAKAWAAGWQNHVTITSSIARLAPSGTTGWVAATIELAKRDYAIPFFVFCVFDKTAAGAWSLVHIQLAI